MTFVITTNEPRKIKDLFGDMCIEVPMNFDFKLFTNSGSVGIERKKVPGDLLSSITDGRLTREVQAMREETQFQIVLLHDAMPYHKDGTVNMRGNKGSNWTKKGVRNLLRTLEYVEGVYIEQADDDEELVQVVIELQEYFDMLKSKHLSFKFRPGLQSSWLMPLRQEKVMYFYQGLPSISAVRAKSLASKFPSPLQLYQASTEDIQQIPGFGSRLADKIYNFLREG